MKGTAAEIRAWTREHPDWTVNRVVYYGKGAVAVRLQFKPTRQLYTIYDTKALGRLLSGAD